MNSALIRNVILTANLPCVSCVISAWCAGAQGRYANGAVGIVAELESGGEANFASSLGDADVCAYKVDGNKIALDCYTIRWYLPPPRAGR